MKQKITMLILFIGLSTIAQTKFEKGYFITLEGVKTECLIKNEDWVNGPSSIQYKLNENAETNTISEKQLKKLEIPTKFVFERHLVDMEKISSNVSELSLERASNYKKESLLLKVVVDGKARLLKYSSKNVNYFYYMLEDKIYHLEYKRYRTEKGSILKNLNYKKTLRDEINCDNKKLNSDIKYKESSFVTYFTDYNSCHNSSSKLYSNQVKKGKFNLRAKFSLGISNVGNPYTNSPIFKFKEEVIFKIGAEFEYVLPFNNNKWSVLLEPTYQSYSSKSESVTQAGDFSYLADYSSIELPLGFRHYFFINDRNKIFVNSGVNFDVVLDGEFSFANEYEREIKTFTNYFVGLGYVFNNKYSLEFRYNTARDLAILNGINDKADYTNMSFKFGYNFL